MKTLAGRLKQVLANTISYTQRALIAGWQLLDQVHIGIEAIEDYRERKEVGIIFRINVEKACDPVDGDFLDKVLEKKGFRVKWRGWMSNCVRFVNFSFLVNERPRGKVFAQRRALRQGDPLSPFSSDWWWIS